MEVVVMTHKAYACSAQNLNGEMNSYYADDMNTYSLYIKDIRKSRRLSREEETELLKKAGGGDIEAKKRVIESNLKLVISIAKKFSNRNNQLSDLIGEGNVGLLIAADKFDLDRKASFATYAAYRVLQNIVRAAYLQSDIVVKPVYVWDRTRRVNRIADSFVNQNGREPAVEEISSMAGISLKSLKNLMDARKNRSIYNTYIDIENMYDCEDGLQDDPLDILVSKEEKTCAHIKVNQAMSGLSERERQIVVMRFGLNGDLPMTLQKVGETLGITRQRVQQLEKRIVGKLRDVLSN